MNDDYSRALLDAVPLAIFLVDDDVRIFDFNTAAARLLNQERGDVLMRRSGEALHCLHAADATAGCGHGPGCEDCVVRNSVREAFQGNRIVRRQAQMDLRHDGECRNFQLLVTAVPTVVGAQRLVLLILEDVSELVHLRRLLPICSHCKRIRDDQEYWHGLESYLSSHLNVDLTHGICPACMEKLQAELAQVRSSSSAFSNPLDERGA